ncbi:hypothetical protein ABT008_02505 [Micromonospora sp. NPDC002389]|uniref:hypothetical protein n=1 Tax=Micromonospora sp. NPDC002389 TaxID=3154272 RepID=UPI0033208594
MTESEEILVSNEFDAFRSEYGPAVRPAGTDAVRRTVRRRRRVAVAVAAAAVLSVVLPVGAYAGLNRTGPAPTPGHTGQPSAPPTPSGSPTPSATPSSTPTTTGPRADGPDGRISRAQLLAARVDLPDWSSSVPPTCTTDGVRLREPDQESRPELGDDIHHGDVDGDGGTDTVALVACRLGEALDKQVVAFSRDDAGRIVTLGQVVGTREGLDDITGVALTADGRVRVEVADIQPCCGVPDWWPQKQWRTYAWSGGGFDQTAGPTRFEVDPRLTDLAMSADDLVLGSTDADGGRYVSVTVKVTNKGPVDVPRLGFHNLSTIGEPAGGDLSECRMVQAYESCSLDGLAAGEQRSFTFRFRLDSTWGEVTPSLLVEHLDEQDRNWPDRKRSDNSVTLRTSR